MQDAESATLRYQQVRIAMAATVALRAALRASLSLSVVASSRGAAGAHTNTLARRTLAGLPAVHDPASKDVGAASAAGGSAVGAPVTPASAVGAAAAPPPPPPPAAPKVHRGSSAYQRLVAFLTGVGVSAVWFYWTVGDDIRDSTAAVDASIAAFKADTGAAHMEMQERVARLEHEIAALRK